MEASLPYHCEDYQPPYSCGFFFQRTDSTHACQYGQPHQAFVDWRSHFLHNSESRFYVPAYRYSQPQRWWPVRRGIPAGYTMRHMSPPAVTRCVSSLSSEVIAESQHSASSQQTRAAQLVCNVSARQADGCHFCPTHPTTLSERRLLEWLDCGLLDHSDQNTTVLRSDRVCRSLVDTSQRPAVLNDAVCMYIDYLTRDNDRVIGDFSVVAGGRRLDTALSTIVTDQLYRDVFCQPSSFPTSRFREWLQLYSVDLEITDPEGRKLTQATFPGCGCEAHQVAHNLTAYPQSSASRSTGMSWSQSGLGASSMTVPDQPSLGAHEVFGTRSRGGRRRCGRRPGRSRGAKRKSDWETNATSHRPSTGQSDQSDVRRSLSSTVDSECDDDSAVVEFLASLQSDAVKRRCRQQELATQQFISPDINPHSQNKVIEEVVDEFQLDESAVLRCDDHLQHVVPAGPLNILPQSSMNVSFPTLTKRQVTNEHFLVASSSSVGDRRCTLPLKMVDDPSDVVEKSSEQ